MNSQRSFESPLSAMFLKSTGWMEVVSGMRKIVLPQGPARSCSEFVVPPKLTNPPTLPFG